MGIRLVLADDHALVRQGLRSVLEEEADLQVVAEAANGRAAVQVAAEHRPDVVVMDVAMPDLNGAEATRQICATLSGVKVIALSAHRERQLVVGMFRAGAMGYVLKAGVVDELVEAIRDVAAGRAYLSPRIAGLVLADYLRHLQADAPSAMAALTPREREVLQLLVEGQDAQAVAGTLHLSVNTVRTHRQHIMEKLDIHSLPELTKFAIREGITSLES